MGDDYNQIKLKIYQFIMKNRELIKKLKRREDSHKGDFGHVLVIGGDHGMGGAVIMTALAASRVGAGKVTVLTRNAHIPALLNRAPNIMYVDENSDFNEIIKNKTVIAIGPGLGKSDWARKLFFESMACDLPKIIDADALNLISETKQKFNLRNAILTPHLGEAARLLNIATDEIKNNREKIIQKLHEKYHATIVLKGHESLILTNTKIHKCEFGNPGMATAGMGDILTGIIAGLAAQNLSCEEAAVLGTNIHAFAGDLVKKDQGEIGMIPLDLLKFLPKILNEKIKI